MGEEGMQGGGWRERREGGKQEEKEEVGEKARGGKAGREGTIELEGT